MITLLTICRTSLIDHPEQSDIKIYNNFTSMAERGHLIYSNTAQRRDLRIHLDPPILLRFLGITNDIYALTICELKLIEKGK